MPSWNFRTIRLMKRDLNLSEMFLFVCVAGNTQSTRKRNGFLREILEGRRKWEQCLPKFEKKMYVQPRILYLTPHILLRKAAENPVYQHEAGNWEKGRYGIHGRGPDTEGRWELTQVRAARSQHCSGMLDVSRRLVLEDKWSSWIVRFDLWMVIRRNADVN